MFRRIEVIHEYQWKGATEWYKTGLCGGMFHTMVGESWLDKLKGPSLPLHKNCKFWFTEDGWNEVGRDVVAALQATKTEYRVLKIKERSVDIFYKDRLEVATRPKRRKYG